MNDDMIDKNMKHIIDKLQELKNQRDALLQEMQREFVVSIKQLFVENEKLHGIYMYLNNHDIQYGDQINFYIEYDDLKLHDYKGDVYEDVELREKLVCLFDDTQDIHELMYGDKFGEFKVTRDQICKF